MNIQLTALKPLLKKLGCVKSDTVIWDSENGVLSARENNLAVYVVDEALKDPEKTVYFLPSKKFTPSINRMSGVLTVRKTDNGGYSFISNKTRIELDHLELPYKFDVPEKYAVKMPTALFQRLIGFASIAVDAKQQGMTFQGMIALAGVSDFLGSYVEAVGTDGKRVCWIKEETETETFSALLPSGLSSVLSNLSDESVEILDTDRFTALRSGNFIAVANKFTSSFPKAKDLFPSKYDYTFSFLNDDLQAALGRIQPSVNEETRAVKLDFTEKGLVLYTEGHGGTAKDEVSYSANCTANPYWALVDHKYLTDFNEEGEVKIHCSQRANFIVLENGSKKYLVARMTINGK